MYLTVAREKNIWKVIFISFAKCYLVGEIERIGGISVLSYLNTVVAGRHSPILHLDVGGRVGELAVGVWAGALLPLILAAHLELEPAGVLLVEEGRHVEHRHGLLHTRDDKRPDRKR